MLRARSVLSPSRGPAGLSHTVQTLHDTTIDEWRLTLDRYLAGDAFDAGDAARAFMIETMLQPLAEECAWHGREASDSCGVYLKTIDASRTHDRA